jgi:hypothetical protein
MPHFRSGQIEIACDVAARWPLPVVYSAARHTYDAAMKRLHRPDLFCWSAFHPPLNVDFNGFAWIRPDGNVLIDPLPMSAHDLAHLRELGGAKWIVLTNANHVRGAAELAGELGASLLGPQAEQSTFPLRCAGWLADADSTLTGMRVLALEGSKTPGELALVLGEDTLITGDLVRAHCGGSLMMLGAAQGLKDRVAAVASIRRLAALPGIEHVLVGDGWHTFHDGRRQLALLLQQLEADGAPSAVGG